MNLSLPKWAKILLVAVFFAGSIIGFLVKLPSGFRHIDKELHAAFYFAAAAFLNLLFAKKNILLHLLLFGILFLFGICIEYSQEYSNTFFHVRIHGRFDIEDVRANLKGLVAFSMLWLIYWLIGLLYPKQSEKK